MAVVFSDFIDFPDGSKHQMQADKVIALIFAICDALGARKQLAVVEQTVTHVM